MKRKINEIFYSIQGEGYYVGTPAVFIRFSGCNLRCSFCDTVHNQGTFFSDEEILEQAAKYPARHVVLTGGEPSLFIDESFVDMLHHIGKYVTVETNGTHILPQNLDWITLSPKFDFCDNAELNIKHCDELKLVYRGQNDVEQYLTFDSNHFYLQPCAEGNDDEDKIMINKTVEFCKKDPRWRLSMQLHKLIHVR